MVGIFSKSLRTGIVTCKVSRSEQHMALDRGYPIIEAQRCTSCGKCCSACPTEAIVIVPTGIGNEVALEPLGKLAVTLAEGSKWQLFVMRCLGCGVCEEACPEGALSCQGNFSERKEWGTAPEGMWSPTRSLHIRHLDGGSCNACDWEMVALTNPVYDIQRFGLDFVASPRHADALMVTGTITRNLQEAVVKTYEAAPKPKLTIAVGTCACSGGLFGAGYACAGGVDRFLPVDIYIPGCPPPPEAMIAGLQQAKAAYTKILCQPRGRSK